MARETRGEMEPTDLKLFTGEGNIHHDRVTCGSAGLLFEPVSQGIVYHAPMITPPRFCINGLGVSTADMKDLSQSQVITVPW